MRTPIVPVVLALTVMGASSGCQLITLAAELAAKALPYLIFFVDAEDPRPDDASPPSDPGVRLALDRARSAPEELPSGWVVLARSVEEAEGRGVLAYARSVPRDGAATELVAFDQELRASHGRVRIVPVDARPLIETPASPGVQGLETSGLVLFADGPLAAACEAHALDE